MSLGVLFAFNRAIKFMHFFIYSSAKDLSNHCFFTAPFRKLINEVTSKYYFFVVNVIPLQNTVELYYTLFFSGIFLNIQ